MLGDMQVLIVGTGDAFTKTHYGSCALLRGPNGLVMIDCPDLALRAVHEAASRHGWNADPLTIDDIIITHLHADHSNGLEGFGFYRFIARRKGLAESPARLHTSRPAAERLWEKLAPAMDPPIDGGRRARLDDFFELHVIAPESPATIAGLSVQCRFTKHPIPTTGLLISDGRATLGWSSDTPFDPDHIEWLSQADLIVHECNHPPVHTGIDDLGALPEDLRRRLRLIHTADDFDRATTDIPVLEDGELISIRPAGRG